MIIRLLTSAPADRLAWRAGFGLVLAGVMATATAANPLFSLLAPFLITDLGIDRSQLGLLFTIVAGGGAATSLVAGPVADRWGGHTLALAIFAAGVGTFTFTATSRSFLGVAVAAAICGVANGAGNPATNKLIGAHLPLGRQGVVMGVKQSGVQAGLVLAGLLLPPAATALGWRTAVWLAALLPASLFVLTLVLVPRDPPRRRDVAGTVLRYRPSPTVRWMTLYGALMGAGGSALQGFMPLYAQEEIGFSVQAAGLAAGAFGLLGVTARIMWSRGSERLSTYAGPLGAIAALSTVAALLILLASPGSGWLLWAGVLLGGGTVTSWNAVTMLAVTSRVEGRFTGRASGIVTCGFLSGYAVAPAAFGWVVDRTGSYDLAWAGVVGMLLVATATTLLWARRQ